MEQFVGVDACGDYQHYQRQLVVGCECRDPCSNPDASGEEIPTVELKLECVAGIGRLVLVDRLILGHWFLDLNLDYAMRVFMKDMK
jgi:hypothetical protein